MKKPVMIFTTLIAISASSVGYLAPSGAGAAPADGTDQKVDRLGKAGLISPAQAEALKRARAAAAGRASEANSAMPDKAKETAPAHQGAQTAPQNAPNGQA